NLHPMLDLILKHVPAPVVDKDGPFKMLATILTADPYLGRCLVGRIVSGTAKINMPVKAMSLDGKTVETFRLSKLLTFAGIQKIPATVVEAGDIICIAGMTNASVSDTICDVSVTEPVPATPIDPPTMAVSITVNDSPLCGKEGKKLTSTIIRERLMAEAETNVAIRVTESANRDAFELAGRGELQIGVLLEQMRREGFEMSVSRPRVLFQKDEAGALTEPYEEIIVDIDDEYTGVVVERLTGRKGDLVDMRPSGIGKTRIVFNCPSRGMIGYQSQFMTDTRGTGVLNRLFKEYGPYKGDITGRRNGALISTEGGKAVAYAIWKLQDRGTMFITHNDDVYCGMIVGENSRDNDMDINVTRAKQLTNVRAS
ncbi:MAG: EF-Tu/IF-2/RF-3 family GTPase, partial [Pseudomonadota bacterium]